MKEETKWNPAKRRWPIDFILMPPKKKSNKEKTREKNKESAISAMAYI